MKVRISPVTGLPFIFRAVILIGPGTRTRFMRRYVRAQSHADIHFIMPLTYKQCHLTMSFGYGFYKLTMWVCGTWYTGAQVDSTFRFMVFRLWKVITDSQMPSVRLSWFRLLLCTQFMVDALIQLSWILLRLFSTSYMSILHTVFNNLELHSSGLALLSWHFPKHFCTGSTNTIVDFVKWVTTIPQRWSSIGSYPMGEFAFVIGSWNILSSTFYV